MISHTVGGTSHHSPSATNGKSAHSCEDRQYGATVGPIIENQTNVRTPEVPPTSFYGLPHHQIDHIASEARDMAFIANALGWMQEHRGIVSSSSLALMHSR